MKEGTTMKQRMAYRTIGFAVLASALAVGGVSCVHAPLKEPVQTAPAQTSAREAKDAKKTAPPQEYQLLRCLSSAPRDCPEEIANHSTMVGIKKEFCRVAERDASILARELRCGPRSKLQISMTLKPDGLMELAETRSERGGCTAWPAGSTALASVGDDVRLPPSKGCRFVLEAFFMEKR
jgi:hypothetical protein